MKLTEQEGSPHPFIKYINDSFNGNVPKVVMDLKGPEVYLHFMDPNDLEEIFVTKNKYFDKNERFKNISSEIFGNSIVLEKSNQEWADKRKVISKSLYKDKIINILKIISGRVSEKVKEYELKIKENGSIKVNISEEINNLVTDCLLSSLFGLKFAQNKFEFIENGKSEFLNLGSYLGRALRQNFRVRYQTLLRRIFSSFDKIFIGSKE